MITKQAITMCCITHWERLFFAEAEVKIGHNGLLFHNPHLIVPPFYDHRVSAAV